MTSTGDHCLCTRCQFRVIKKKRERI
jgi:hypothetical protein